MTWHYCRVYDILLYFFILLKVFYQGFLFLDFTKNQFNYSDI